MINETRKYCLNYILIAFGLLGGELLLVALEQQYHGVELSQFSLSQSLIHWLLIILIWLAGSLYCYQAAKKDGINPLSFVKTKLDSRRWLMVGGIVLSSLVLSSYLWGWQFKPLAEWQAMVNRYGKFGSSAFIFQNLYYITEAFVILLIVAFGQLLGESLSKEKRLPWGSLALSLTWGLGHLLSKDVGTALYCLVFSLFCGLVFLLVKKNATLSLAIITLMFIS